MTYTKGPWEVLPKETYGIRGFVIAAKRGRYIAETITYGSADIKENWDEANARLIASAPELLEACKEAVLFVNNYLAAYDNPDADDLSELLANLIDKAEGKI